MEKIFSWNNDKNETLKRERGVSFEDVLLSFELDNVLDVLKHPNEEKYSNQKIFVVLILDYIYIVPFVENDTEIFLKTIIPNRKMTKKYLRS